MPMEDIDKNEVSDEGISEDEDLMMREVVQGDADLCFLHHYLSEVFRNGDNLMGKGAGRRPSFCPPLTDPGIFFAAS